MYTHPQDLEDTLRIPTQSYTIQIEHTTSDANSLKTFLVLWRCTAEAAVSAHAYTLIMSGFHEWFTFGAVSMSAELQQLCQVCHSLTLIYWCWRSPDVFYDLVKYWKKSRSGPKPSPNNPSFKQHVVPSRRGTRVICYIFDAKSCGEEQQWIKRTRGRLQRNCQLT